MNARHVSALILAAALSVSASAPLFAASQNEIPTSFTVRTLIASSNGDMKIVRGMDREDVSYAMKYRERQELSPDVWVYTGYHSENDLANARECWTMVIKFAQGKVVDLQLVNKAAVTVIALNLKSNSSSKNLASK
jgi:hypothetical protein